MNIYKWIVASIFWLIGVSCFVWYGSLPEDTDFWSKLGVWALGCVNLSIWYHIGRENTPKEH